MLLPRIPTLLVSLAVLISSVAGAASPSESQIQSAFIYQFTRYVTWPASHEKDPFVITIIGETELLPHLKELAKTKTIGEKSIEIRLAQAPGSNLSGSNIVILGDNQNHSITHLLDSVKKTPVLTISNQEGLAQRGVIINFYKDGEKLRFEINLEQAKLQGLAISSQLLKLARIVP